MQFKKVADFSRGDINVGGRINDREKHSQATWGCWFLNVKRWKLVQYSSKSEQWHISAKRVSDTCISWSLRYQ